ncbi:MAG: hypothetical protein IPO66_13450 [Rhodanobacteraceae bacterium]|nr:hypothetical protein [Rhodanobacteraceae bacterium]
MSSLSANLRQLDCRVDRTLCGLGSLSKGIECQFHIFDQMPGATVIAPERNKQTVTLFLSEGECHGITSVDIDANSIASTWDAAASQHQHSERVRRHASLTALGILGRTLAPDAIQIKMHAPDRSYLVCCSKRSARRQAFACDALVTIRAGVQPELRPCGN